MESSIPISEKQIQDFISEATQLALNLKANLAGANTFTGSQGIEGNLEVFGTAVFHSTVDLLSAPVSNNNAVRLIDLLNAVTGVIKQGGNAFGAPYLIGSSDSQTVTIMQSMTPAIVIDNTSATHSRTTNNFAGDIKITGAGDVEVTNSSRGIILKSPNGTRYRITVSDTGVLTSTAI